LSEQNKNLLKQLRQSQNILLEESNQNLSRRSSVTSIASVFSNTSVSNAVAESSSQKLYTSISDSILLNMTVASNSILKPHRSKAKNICRELKLQKVVYQDYLSNLRDLIKAGVLDLNKKCKSRDKDEDQMQNDESQDENEDQMQDSELEITRNKNKNQEQNDEIEIVLNKDQENNKMLSNTKKRSQYNKKKKSLVTANTNQKSNLYFNDNDYELSLQQNLNVFEYEVVVSDKK
ncbi:17310_t:CDS:2, partial [Funneliformis caledonium]